MNSLNCYSTSKGHGGVRGGIITNTISWHIYLVSDAYQYCNCTARYLAFLDLRLFVRSRKTNTTASRNLAVFWQYWFWRLGHSCRKLRLFRVVSVWPDYDINYIIHVDMKIVQTPADTEIGWFQQMKLLLLFLY